MKVTNMFLKGGVCRKLQAGFSWGERRGEMRAKERNFSRRMNTKTALEERSFLMGKEELP